MKTKSYKSLDINITSINLINIDEDDDNLTITLKKGVIEINKTEPFKKVIIKIGNGRIIDVQAIECVVYAKGIDHLRVGAGVTIDAVKCNDMEVKSHVAVLNNCTGFYENKNGTVRLYGNSDIYIKSAQTVLLNDVSSGLISNVERLMLQDNSSCYIQDCTKVIAKDFSLIKRAYFCEEILLTNYSTLCTRSVEGVKKIIATDSTRLEVITNEYLQIVACKFASIFLDGKVTLPIIKQNFFGVIHHTINKTKAPMIVYKKLAQGRIAELELPKGVEYQHQSYTKCRTKKALVKRIYCDSIDYTSGVSIYNNRFIYKVGEIVESKYNKSIDECSDGIHFFLTEQEAIDYVI